MASAVSVAPPAFALDINDVLGIVDLGGENAGLPQVDGGGIPLDGLAEVKLLGSTLVSSESTEPLLNAGLLDPASDEGQRIADVRVGGSDLLDLDDVLGTLDIGGLLGGDGGSGDLVGDLVDSVAGLTGGGNEDGGSGDLVGGLLSAVGNTVGGLTGGGNGNGSAGSTSTGGGNGGGSGGLVSGLSGGSNSEVSGGLVGGVTNTVGGLVGGLTGGLLN
ncbi:hypothetical protein BG454_00775 [Roseinatronobacter bogoriensis subsp. barguzinensis]|uniref:Uncharacterized protein n=2 Tax=Roseinatronobacter bogoriensis TaxID=119542 RepID=A0A2K8K507_9RHOB|nr:hypothetical protein BG454_00775 [Rhodobaca barguzinensis]